MNILIVDDHAEVRRGLREILADALPDTNFSEAGNGDEALSLLASSECGLMLLDINMPGSSGLDVLRDVKRNYSRLPVIIVSVQPEDQYAARCLRDGAAAYINKNSAPEELVAAARKILEDGSHIRPRIAEKQIVQVEAAIEKIGQLT